MTKRMAKAALGKLAMGLASDIDSYIYIVRARLDLADQKRIDATDWTVIARQLRAASRKATELASIVNVDKP